MKRRTIIALVCAAALWSCRRETVTQQRPVQPKAQQTTSDTTAPPRDLAEQKVDVTIPLMANTARCAPLEKTEFAVTDPIALTLELLESPQELQVSARILDARGETVAEATAPGEGKKSATLTIREKVKPGTYRLAGYWGGNVVCEREITVK